MDKWRHQVKQQCMTAFNLTFVHRMEDLSQSRRETKHGEADWSTFVTQGLHFSLFQTMLPLQAVLLGTELTSGLHK